MLIRLIQMNISIPEKILYGLIMIFALMLSFSIHEFMHAFAADRLGDPTPRNMGRLTLNPLAHMDPTGTILLLLAGFGWGKPVMYNPNRLNKLKSPRLMNIMVHLAGVTGNFILALLSGIIATLIFRTVKLAAGDCSASMARTYDIEIQIPSMNGYKEVSSVSNARDYQARRGNIRFRREETGKIEYVHTLNGSGLATSRIFPAMVEQNQRADGSIVVPEVLRKYLGGLEVITK